MNGLEQTRALYAPPATREELLHAFKTANLVMGFLTTLAPELQSTETYTRIVAVTAKERDAALFALKVMKK